jgi:hypothetical protein
MLTAFADGAVKTKPMARRPTNQDEIRLMIPPFG